MGWKRSYLTTPPLVPTNRLRSMSLERVMNPRRGCRSLAGGRGKRRRQSAAQPKWRAASRNPSPAAEIAMPMRNPAPLPNHNAPVQTKPPTQPIIELAGLLGMVELAQRLRTSPNAEQPQERAACLKERFPPASREEVPTDLGGAAAAKPQTSGGAGGQTPRTPHGDTSEQRFGSVGGE